MHWISITVYNFAISLYGLIARVASLFSLKARLWAVGRAKTEKRIRNFHVTASKNRVWFHCSSLGEFEQAQPLIEKVKNELEDCVIYLSFFSPSGYEQVKKKEVADFIFYLPIDTQKNAAFLVEHLQPTLVFWTKYDFFYHHLNALKEQKTPLVLYSARFLSNQIFFKPWGYLHREMLQTFTRIFVQDENSKTLLNEIAISSEIAADTRFDRVVKLANTEFKDEIVEQFIQQEKYIWIAGSTWEKDEEILAEAFSTKESFKLIIAPHQIDKPHLDSIENHFKNHYLEVAFYTEFKAEDVSKKILVIDNIGMLSKLYRYAKICYVGGGFGAGIHNVLEAVVYGKPVVFGTHYHKSLESVILLKNSIAFSISNSKELLQTESDLNNENKLQSIENTALKYIKNNSGGTNKIFNYAKRFCK